MLLSQYTGIPSLYTTAYVVLLAGPTYGLEKGEVMQQPSHLNKLPFTVGERRSWEWWGTHCQRPLVCRGAAALQLGPSLILIEILCIFTPDLCGAFLSMSPSDCRCHRDQQKQPSIHCPVSPMHGTWRTETPPSRLRMKPILICFRLQFRYRVDPDWQCSHQYYEAITKGGQ